MALAGASITWRRCLRDCAPRRNIRQASHLVALRTSSLSRNSSASPAVLVVGDRQEERYSFNLRNCDVAVEQFWRRKNFHLKIKLDFLFKNSLSNKGLHADDAHLWIGRTCRPSERCPSLSYPSVSSLRQRRSRSRACTASRACRCCPSSSPICHLAENIPIRF